MNSASRYLWDMLLYACMGCFSYFFLVHYTDIPVRFQDRLMTAHAFLAVIVSFCGVGLSVRCINGRLLTYYPYFLRNKRMLSAGLVAAAVALLLSNYLLLVFAKALAGVACPFQLQRSGLTVIMVVWLVELVMVGQFILNRFYVDMVRLYKRAEELETSTAEARYRALQNQLNPHFLFNSLNTLVSEIEYNPVNAIEFTRNLADTYRYILYCQDKHTVELNEELQFLDTYVLLQKVRLGDCLEVDNRIADKFWETLVPPLSLQLLVENVIKHNVISMKKPMTVKMWVEYQDKEAWICVSNAMRPKQGNAISGKGLENLSQRYRLLCGKEIRVEQDEKEFIVRLPLLDGQDECSDY